ncbi:MAG: ATP-grasp domain-containing protein [Candidatus Marinimicrobia bacterium]|nr:ATP-grasp domain-containing protein [Candidatus Neomarinimicrobiota bacterium]
MSETIFLIDGPYVSDFLKQSIYEFNIPVVKTAIAKNILIHTKTNFLSERDAIAKLKKNPAIRIYTNSENALTWIYSHVTDHEYIKHIHEAKDKVLFRRRLKDRHPNFYFQEFDYNKLRTLNSETLPFPLVVKPSVGFFSLGVHGVKNREAWIKVLESIDESIQGDQELYPDAVLNNRKFIIEAQIKGDEFAVDCYFDDQGEPVVLNLMKHLFASETDMNDRVYISSVGIMRQYLKTIENYLKVLGGIFSFTNYPAHIELRITSKLEINTIEINPLRFGGWCSTPDLAWYAWGMNLYEHIFKGIKPDWDKILSVDAGVVHALVVMNNGTGVDGKKILSFNYDKLLKKIKKLYELRKTNFREYPLFGFVMCQVPEQEMEVLYELLHSDLWEYIEQ